MNQAPTPANQPNLFEQVHALEQQAQAHESEASRLHGEAAAAARSQEQAELQRSAIAVQTAAIGVNAAVSLIDRVAMTPDKAKQTRAHTAATRYDIGHGGEHIDARVAHVTRDELAPAWRQIFTGDRDSAGVNQRDQFSGRVDIPAHEGHHHKGLIVGRLANKIHGAVANRRAKNRQTEADILTESQPHVGELVTTLDPGLTGKKAANISEAVGVAAAHLSHHVAFATDPSISEGDYRQRIRISTPAGIRKNNVDKYINDYDNKLPEVAPDGSVVDREAVVQEVLTYEDRRLAWEGDLVYRKLVRGQQVTAEESQEIRQELGRIQNSLSDPNIEPNTQQALESRRTMFHQMLSPRPMETEDHLRYREYFVSLAQKQLGVISVRHILRGTASHGELKTDMRAMRQERDALIDEFNRSQLPGYTHEDIEGARDEAARRRLLAQHRQRLIKQAHTLNAQLDRGTVVNQDLTNPQSDILPVERRLIPEIVDAATNNEFLTRHDIIQQHDKAERSREEQQAKAAAAREQNRRAAAARVRAYHLTHPAPTPPAP